MWSDTKKKIRRYGLKRIVFYLLYYGIAIHLTYGERWGPVGKFSSSFRKSLCRRLFRKTGVVFRVGKGVDFGFNGHLITLGERANLGNYFWFRGNGELVLGNDIAMGEFVIVYTQDHNILPFGYDGFITGKVVIGNKVWIGGRVTILKGVTIGNNVAIGAGSVVTKDVPDNVVIAGNPARIIRKRL